MRLVDFRLTGFAQHQDTFLTFNDGSPSVIVGPNESGKSQLLAGLIGTFFGLSDWQSAVPWHGPATLRGELRLESGNHQFEIVREFEAGRVTVLRDGTAIYEGRGLATRHTQEDERYQKLLSHWLGFSDMDVFRGVVFIEQDQLGDDRLSKRSSEIKRIISGSREASYESAIKDLDGKLDQLKRRPRKHNDREIEQVEAEIAELEQRARQAEAAERQSIEVTEAEQAAQEAVRQIQQRLEVLEGLMQTYRDHRELKEEVQRSTREAERISRELRQAKQAQERRERLAAEVASLRVDGDPDLKTVQNARFEREQANHDYRRVETEQANVASEMRRLRSQTATPPVNEVRTGPNGILLAVAGFIALLSLALGFAVSVFMLFGLLLALALAVIAVRSVGPASSSVNTTNSAKLQLLEQQIANLGNDLSQIQSRLNEITQRITPWLEASGEPDLDHLITRLEEYQRAQVRLGELASFVQADVERLEAEENSALNHAAVTERQVRLLEADHPELHDLTPEQAATHRETLKQLEADKTQSVSRLNELHVRREVLQQTAVDDAAALAVVIHEKQDDLARKRQLASALELAIETMQTCVHDFQEHALEPVALQASGLMKSFTTGRYDAVTIDQQSMIPSVILHGVGGIGPGVLSRGTRDQLYLAVRVGLIDALSGGRKLPLILDDPCVHFDDQRLQAAMKVLEEIARERQVIILTKDETYERWFGPVLQLQRGSLRALADVTD